jgi:hypothetical protein
MPVSANDDEIRETMIWCVEELSPLVEAGLPGFDRTAFKFRQARPEHDDHEISDERLKEAIEAFNKLPEAVQRTVCNGWHPHAITDRPTRRQLIHDEEEFAYSSIIYRYLDIDGGEKPVSDMTWAFTQGVEPVRVMIRFGTSKANALEAIRRVERAILDHFETLIDGVPHSIDELDKAARHAALKAGMAESSGTKVT